MAEQKEIINEDEEKSGGGQGNKNALAYGLLQGAGYNTDGMSPSQAWDLVNAAHLMEKFNAKKNEEEAEREKKGKEEFKKSGGTKEQVIQQAGNVANHVAIHTSSPHNAKKAVDAIENLQKSYGLEKLDKIQTAAHLGGGLYSATASANGSVVNIQKDFLNNPHSFYRSAVTKYAESNKQMIEDLKERKEAIEKAEGWSETRKRHTQDKIDRLIKETEESLKYGRHNVCYEGQEVECVITHEMGHSIADQLFGQINGSRFLKVGATNVNEKRMAVDVAYNLALSNGDIYKISKYAAKDKYEFYAECFAMYKIGKEELPPKIKEAIEFTLK